MLPTIPGLDPHIYLTYGGLSGASVYLTEMFKVFIGSKYIKNTAWYDLISLVFAEVLCIGALILLGHFSWTNLWGGALFAFAATHSGNKVYDYLSLTPSLSGKLKSVLSFIGKSLRIVKSPQNVNLNNQDFNSINGINLLNPINIPASQSVQPIDNNTTGIEEPGMNVAAN